AGIPTNIYPSDRYSDMGIMGRCTQIVNWYNLRGRWHKRINYNWSYGGVNDNSTPDAGFIPKKGDLILFETSGGYGDGPDHIGIVYEYSNGTVYYVNGNNSNGEVASQSIALSSSSVFGFCRPDYIDNELPVGCADNLWCDGHGEIQFYGWAFDPDNSDASITVEGYIDRTSESGSPDFATRTGLQRVDVKDAYGTGEYSGFADTVYLNQRGIHTVNIYAVDINTGERKHLKTFTVDIQNNDTYSISTDKKTYLLGETVNISAGGANWYTVSAWLDGVDYAIWGDFDQNTGTVSFVPDRCGVYTLHVAFCYTWENSVGKDDYTFEVVEPIAKPTAKPTAAPTAKPTAAPTAKPTAAPTAKPTAKPTAAPTVKPKAKPTAAPTVAPTAKPTAKPTVAPTAKPTAKPTSKPTAKPTTKPSTVPSANPSETTEPSEVTTPGPEETVEPSEVPSFDPDKTADPFETPTEEPEESPEPSLVPIDQEDGIADFVKRCYRVAFDRDPDEGGFSYWYGQISEGQITGSTVANKFIFSTEYENQQTTNEQFLKDLYTMFLGRDPDKDGFNGWNGALKSGMSREAVFAGFANSEEFFNLCSGYEIPAGYYTDDIEVDKLNRINLFVTRLYQTCLGRLGDQGGQMNWVSGLIKGKYTGISCACGFIKSQEYQSLDVTDEVYIENLYTAFMGREPDEGGFNSWLGAMNDGASKDNVLAGFANSDEFQGICRASGITAGYFPNSSFENSSEIDRYDKVNLFVDRLYKTCLGRLSDKSGQQNWVKGLMNGSLTGISCAANFIRSDEYVRLNLSDTDYVKSLYVAMMGRTYDEKGLNGWVRNLSLGMTREQVFEGFANSQEFENICKDYGITKGRYTRPYR
ncbi:MAG: DUF4214 domain-containing protein, partial [Lachnospiraceae bacterium]|nr:DUF4214 domain-containing protein [Lachnospiraceae bacterium]